MRPLLLRAFLVLLGVCLAGWVSERLLRAQLVRSRPGGYPAMYQRFDDGRVRHRPGFRGTMGGEQVELAIDADGWRMDPNGPPAHPRFKVALIGDSYIFGHLVAWEDSPAGLLQAELAGLGLAAWVRDYGFPGYCPVEYAEWVVPEALAWKPDLVVIAIYTGNDHRDVLFNGSRRLGVLDGYLQELSGIRAGDAGPFDLALAERSVVWRRLRSGLFGLAKGGSLPKTPCEHMGLDAGLAADVYRVPPPAHMVTAYALLDELLERCVVSVRAAEAPRVLLWTLPSMAEYDPSVVAMACAACGLQPQDFDLARPRAAIEALAVRLDVPYHAAIGALAAHAATEGAAGLILDTHLTSLGNRIASADLAPGVAALLLADEGTLAPTPH